MPTRGNGVAAGVQEVADRARRLARLEVELATFELRRKAAALGAGVVVLVAGAVLGLYALGFLLAAGAAALANVLPTWAALLVVGGALVLCAGLAVGIGVTLLRRGSPPVPEQAIEEARTTAHAIGGSDGG